MFKNVSDRLKRCDVELGYTLMTECGVVLLGELTKHVSQMAATCSNSFRTHSARFVCVCMCVCARAPVLTLFVKAYVIVIKNYSPPSETPPP